MSDTCCVGPQSRCNLRQYFQAKTTIRPFPAVAFTEKDRVCLLPPEDIMLLESTVQLPFSLAIFQELFHPPNAEAIMRIAFRWFHFVAGIAWIGLLYFFNLVNVPFQKGLDADTKKKVNP